MKYKTLQTKPQTLFKNSLPTCRKRLLMIMLRLVHNIIMVCSLNCLYYLLTINVKRLDNNTFLKPWSPNFFLYKFILFKIMNKNDSKISYYANTHKRITTKKKETFSITQCGWTVIRIIDISRNSTLYNWTSWIAHVIRKFVWNENFME